MDSHQLPFELTITAATDWLQSISHLNCINSADQLNKVIKQLRTIDTETKTVLDILLLLTPPILSVCSTIELSFLSDTGNKTTIKSRKIEKLCFQLLKHFVLAVSHITCSKTLSEKDKCIAIYMAIQLIGFSQRLSAIVHQHSVSSLWEKLGDLYILAKENNILNQEVDHKIKDFNNQACIESALKCTLLFSILAPYQCSTVQVKAIFLFTQQYGNLLHFGTHETSGSFFWNPESESAPHQDCKQISDTSINISTKELLSFTQSSDHSTLVDSEVLTHIITQLSTYEDLINSVIPSMLIINHFFIGLTNISEYLKKIVKLNKIQQFSSQYIETKSNDVFSVMPMPATFEKSDLSSSNNENLLKNASSAKILQTKNNQFVIAETNQIDCKIGNIILLCNSENSSELGIIRQIKTTNQSGTLHTLIEKIPGIPSPELINNPGVANKQALIINNGNSNPAFFIAPCKLSNGTRIMTTTEKNYTLDRLVDFSPYYMKYLTTNEY